MKLIKKTIVFLVAATICFSVNNKLNDLSESEKEQTKDTVAGSTIAVLETVIECIEELADN